MWEVVDSEDPDYLANLERLGNKHPQETEKVFNQLSTIHICLEEGMPLPKALDRNFIHHKYKNGLKSLGDRHGKGKIVLRLYFYPDDAKKVIVILGINDKSNQEKDVKAAGQALERYLNRDVKGG